MTSKVVLITGTSSGVGLKCAIQFARAGYVTYATMRNLDRAGKLKEEIAAAGVESNVKVISLDVADPKSITDAVKQIVDVENRLDVLVNNAGYSAFGGIEMLTLAQMKDQFDTNFFGAVMTMQAVLPQMRAQKSGSIINISSIGGVWGQPFNDCYCASKFALEGFSESMVPVYSQLGIKISCVEPGAIQTEFIANAKRPENIPDDLKPLLGQVMSQYQSGREATPGYIQSGDDVAAVILATAENPNPNFRVQTNPVIQKLFDGQLADVTGNAGPNMARLRFFSNKSPF